MFTLHNPSFIYNWTLSISLFHECSNDYLLYLHLFKVACFVYISQSWFSLLTLSHEFGNGRHMCWLALVLMWLKYAKGCVCVCKLSLFWFCKFYLSMEVCCFIYICLFHNPGFIYTPSLMNMVMAAILFDLLLFCYVLIKLIKRMCVCGNFVLFCFIYICYSYSILFTFHHTCFIYN